MAAKSPPRATALQTPGSHHRARLAQLFNRPAATRYRGDRVTLELHLWAASHNYLKAIRHQARTAPAAA
jgi:hypothetical protein